MGKVLVTGSGGFIGGHLVGTLRDEIGGSNIRAVDLKAPGQWHQRFPEVENRTADLRDKRTCRLVTKDVDVVYNLAADMGGMGFIENNKAACMLSVLINTHLLQSAIDFDVDRYFYASSACVYAASKQLDTDVTALKEEDAYPAMPEDGYGWEKLFSERMCRHFREDMGLETRVVRFHNVYGPHGTYDGGREKAPAAICRKVIEAQLSGDHRISIWGDGEQTRSFMYIDDCIQGIQLVMNSGVVEPINVGSSELVSINGLVDIVENIAGIRLEREYDLTAPQGVRGRNSDNTMIRHELDWEPSTSLQSGIEQTYKWILGQMIR